MRTAWFGRRGALTPAYSRSRKPTIASGTPRGRRHAVQCACAGRMESVTARSRGYRLLEGVEVAVGAAEVDGLADNQRRREDPADRELLRRRHDRRLAPR